MKRIIPVVEPSASSISKAALNTTVPGQAVVSSVIAANGLTQNFTGVDVGTGDVVLGMASNTPITQYSLPINEVWRWKVPDATPVYSSPIFIADFPIASLSFRGPVLIFQGFDWFIYCMNAITGAVIWRHATGGPCYGRCQAADVDGDGEYEVFGASHDGKIWSFTSDGSNRFQFKNVYDREGGSVAAPLSVTSSVGTVVTLTGTNFVPNCFVRSTSSTTNNASLSVIAGTGSGQTKVIKSNASGTITVATAFSPVLDATSKVRVIPKDPSDVIYQHAGTLSNESGVWYLYITGGDFQIVKINANTGAIIWRFSTKEAIEPYPLIIDINKDGILECLTGSIDQNIYCLNAVDGTQLWKTTVGNGVDCFLAASDVDNDGVIEVALTCRDNRVYLLNGNTGAIKWVSTDMGGDGDARVLITSESGTKYLYAVNDTGSIAKFDSTLKIKWLINLSNIEINSSPILVTVASDGKPHVIVSDMRGTITFVHQDGTITGSLFERGSVEGVIKFSPSVTAYGASTPTIYRAMFVPSTDGYMTCYGDLTSTHSI